ncbi:acetoacetate--CoA ligase [Bosea sp. TND4EK4]|uniref:acetoacetate--CoA ligase n=1 Tax=Bosea sp. TND4EK4 TaxID=1907408 RepID=UPI000971446E|nr:acetoacetate--CoA ligase [Bosea sp. TND4EK4]
MTAPLWEPSPDRIASEPMTAFMRRAAEVSGRPIVDYAALHRWSVEDRDAFWSLIWDFCGVIGEKGTRVLQDGAAMRGARFFPDARLNFAENLLRRRGSSDAIIFRGENKVARRWSWDELAAMMSRIRQLFEAHGVKAGDRVAGMMPNMPETVAAMLATASLGAVWSSCSPDFGSQGVLDRFRQIEPVIFIAPDGYWYAGKQNDVSAKVKEIATKLPSVRATIIVDYLGTARQVAPTIPGAMSLEDAIAPYTTKTIDFARQPFDHPLYILFSSGTTGIPKCIVHSAGGTLIQHLKEQKLHAGVLPGERFFWFATCSWMMWNWLVSNLASEATLLLYDGSPFYPQANAMFDYAEAEKMTYFGTSAKYIDAVRKAELNPKKTHDLSSLKAILSTGSALAPDSFTYVYSHIKDDVHLASVSGGTDIVASFVTGIPTEPVWIGEIQGPALGMAVDVWNDDGCPVRGEKGELVCTAAFPSMPIGFWNDPDGAKYRSAYFERFDQIWCHGDFAEWTQRGGMIIYGRSDATLNPGGVRIGTAEIYNQVEQLEEIVEALCVGQSWEDDVRVVLFVRLAAGVSLDSALTQKIQTQIRTGASPRHVPARIVAVADIPRTKSGKVTELVVRDLIHGRMVTNKDALANPEALDLFVNLPELQT